VTCYNCVLYIDGVSIVRGKRIHKQIIQSRLHYLYGPCILVYRHMLRSMYT